MVTPLRSSNSRKARSTAGRTSWRRDRFELKDGGAGEDGIENGEVGVLRGGSDDGDLAVLHELQQGLLLLFIEILDLIQVEQHPVGRQQGVNISDDLPNVRNGGGGGVEPVQGAVGLIGDDVGHCGLAGAGRAEKDHVGHLTALDDAAQNPVLAQDVALPHHVLQGLRPNFIGQRTVLHLCRLLSFVLASILPHFMTWEKG